MRDIRKSLIIINRTCSDRKSPDFVRKMTQYLHEHLGSAEIVFSDYPGHTGDLVKAASQYDTIVAAGGDGTISEVINQMDLDRQILGIIPMGKGNSLARDLSLSTFQQAAESILSENISEIDLVKCRFETESGEVKTWYAVSTNGFGFTAETAIMARKYFNRVGGAGSLLAAGTMRTFCLGNYTASISIDGHPEKNIKFSNMVINNTVYSGWVSMFPEADLGDGKMDIKWAKPGFFSHLLTLFSGGIPSEKAQTLTVKLGEAMPLMLDGEIFNSIKTAEFSVEKKRVKIYA